LTIAVGNTYVPPAGYMIPASILGMGLLGLVFGVDRSQKSTMRRTRLWALGSAVLLLGLLLGAVGCSNSSNHRAGAPPGTTVMVVGTAGGVSHSAPLALTIQ
jgi:hypothetical protein